ncbi:unnamed protein product, partial [Pocillopora meandrina]
STLFNAETSELFSQLLGLKFDQKFAAFKRDLDEKEAITQSQLKKLKTESKASSSFNFKAKKVQYRFNSSLLDAIDGAVKTISKGNLSAANSELKRVKILITKRNKLIHFAYKSLAGWTVVEALVKIRERKRRNVSSRPNPTTTLNSARLHLLDHPLAVLFLLISLLFCMESFRGRQPQKADKRFSCGQRGHWANSSSCPNRFRGTIPAVTSSKNTN